MITLAPGIEVPDDEIEISAIRAQGAGGQNVNKVSSAVHLRFDIRASSLPEHYKTRLLSLSDHRITRQGVVVIKAQQSRSQDNNREDALQRLAAMVEAAGKTDKPRRPTRPSRNARKKRMDSKTQRGQIKGLRGKVDL